jgi:hypothetical protein
MMYDASDRSHVKDAERSARVSARERQQIVIAIMGQMGSRAWMHELLVNCHIFAPSFTGEALTSAFNEGQRNIGLILMADIMSACPNLYVTMMEEANVRDAAADSRRANQGNGRDDSEPVPTAADFDGYDDAGNRAD